MVPALLVALGGAIGSVGRFKVSEWVLASQPGWKFPIGTFVVNVAGCLTIGLLAGLAERPGGMSTEARLLLFTGLVGGFTTFSAFGLETFTLLRRGDALIAFSYVALSVIVGLAAVALGFAATEWTTR